MLRLKKFVLGSGFVALAVCTTVARAAQPDNYSANKGDRCVLVFKVDEKKTDWRPEKMDSLLAAVRQRLKSGGVHDMTVRARGTNMVEIKMPFVSGGTPKERQANAEAIRKHICTVGVLEFRIVATRRFDQSLIEAAAAARKAGWEESPGDSNENGRVFPDPKTGKRMQAAWCRVRENSADRFKDDPAAITLSGGKDKDGKPTSHIELLVLAPESDSRDVTGKYIRDARCNANNNQGGWEVDVALSDDGGKKFGLLTGEHLPVDIGQFRYKLAIIMDGVLITAPSLVNKISDRFRITADFDKREAEELAQIINDGSLPAVLDPVPVSESIEKADSTGAPSADKADGKLRDSK
jgi:preprotein translocase subunit SecD